MDLGRDDLNVLNAKYNHFFSAQICICVFLNSNIINRSARAIVFIRNHITFGIPSIILFRTDPNNNIHINIDMNVRIQFAVVI